MKIMFAVATYDPSQDGVAMITGYLARGLARRGHQVRCLTSVRNKEKITLPADEIKDGVEIHRMRIETNWPIRMNGVDSDSTPKRYLEMIREYAPDVLIVVCSQIWTLDWLIEQWDEVKKLPCKKVFYSHGYSSWKRDYPIGALLKKRNLLGAYSEWKQKKYYEELHRYLKEFDVCLYLTKENNSTLYAETHGLSNGEILENAIDDAFYRDDLKHEETDFAMMPLRVLYVANYGDGKNQAMLLDAFMDAKLSEEYGPLELHFVGTQVTDYLLQLEDIAEKRSGEVIDRRDDHDHVCRQGKKEIHFHVQIPRMQVLDLYRHCNLFACTSRLESWGIVHREAALTGMPVISTTVGNVSEMEGILLADTKEALAGELVTLSQERDKAYSLGQTLRRYQLAQKSREEDKVNQLEQLLFRITNK